MTELLLRVRCNSERSEPMTNLKGAADDVDRAAHEILSALDNTERVDVERVVERVEAYNQAVEAHEKAIPLTPDKLTVKAPRAFSELSESEQHDWLMEWWRSLDKGESMAQHLVDAERELRDRRPAIRISGPDFGYLVEDTFTEFRDVCVNEESFEAIDAGDALYDALMKMQTEVAGRACEIWKARGDA